MGYHVDQVARHDILGNGSLGTQTPSAIDFEDHALIDEVVQEGRDEQWLPLGAAEQGLGKGRSQLLRLGSAVRDGAPPPPVTIGRAAIRCSVRESPNLDAVAELDVRRRWCRSGDRMRGEVRRSSALTPREARQNVQRREVTPVQVLENDGQRAIRTQYLHQVAEFAQHSFPCGPEHFVLKSRAVRLRHKTGHLEQPGRRMGPNCLQHRRPAWATTPRHQGIDQRMKGFIRPETLRAAPAQHVDAAVERAARWPSR